MNVVYAAGQKTRFRPLYKRICALGAEEEQAKDRKENSSPTQATAIVPKDRRQLDSMGEESVG